MTNLNLNISLGLDCFATMFREIYQAASPPKRSFRVEDLMTVIATKPMFSVIENRSKIGLL